MGGKCGAGSRGDARAKPVGHPRCLREEGADAVAGHAKLALESLLRSVEVSTSYFLCENACAKYTFSNFCRSVTIWTKSGDNNVDLERIRC